MKSFVIALAVALIAATSVPGDAFARRIGGGGTAGMQRSVPPRATPDAPKPAAPAAQPAGPTAAAAAAPAAAAKRSWLGPIAGLAAGLGIAALMSHLGMGEAFGNMLTMLLLAGVAFFAIRFLLRRFGPKAPTGAGNLQFAGAGAPMQPTRFEPQAFGGGSNATLAAAAPTANALPAGFDADGFERIAKMIFIRLQAANDAGDLNDLRAFTTPEMFAVVRLELQERGPSAQRTDVVRVDAEVLDVASEVDRQIVSVRFHGLIREQIDGVAEPFDEVWHLVKPADGSREWAIAGIQQSHLALAQAA
ncbi:MAG: 39S ribosomal protein L45 [Burkholderiales bacterium]|nr:39S ribosomal protein L45 [Burkholderiales bacterium]